MLEVDLLPGLKGAPVARSESAKRHSRTRLSPGSVSRDRLLVRSQGVASARGLIRLGELEAMVGQAIRIRLPDVHSLELRGFVAGLLTSFGLAAVSLARRGISAGFAEVISTFNSRQGFDFFQLPREKLLRFLDAASGLGIINCDIGLHQIEAEVERRLEEKDAVIIAGLGRIRRLSGEGLELSLADDLRIAAPTEGPPVVATY